MKTHSVSVIVLLLVVPASACSPAQTPTVALSTAVPATSAPTAVQAIVEFSTGDLGQGSAEQPAGKYRTPAWFDVPFEFETDMNYLGGGQASEFGQIFALERGQNALGHGTHRLVFFAFPSDVSQADLMEQLHELPLLDSGEMEEITLSDMTSTRWDAVAQPNPTQTGESGVADGTIAIPPLYEQMRFEGTWHTATPEARLRFITFEVPGHTMLIYLEAPGAEFKTWTGEAEQLLKTVTLITRTETVAEPATSVESETSVGEVWAEPGGILAIDSKDNVYIIPQEDLIIYKYESNGNLLTQWGGRGSGKGQFHDQVGGYYGIDLTIDAQGNVYVADYGNFRIQKFDSNGQFLLQWGEQGENPGQFAGAWTLDVDSQGNVYVGDEGSSRVQKFDSQGHFLTEWGQYGYGTGDYDFRSIIYVKVDHEDNLYVADYFLKQVKKFDSGGKLLSIWDTCYTGANHDVPVPLRPVSLAFDAQNNVYVLDGTLKRVCIYDDNGNQLGSWGKLGTGLGEFDFYEGDASMAIDSQGNLYVSDGTSDSTGNNRVQKFPVDAILP